ncbi:homoserine kinase [Oceanobacillus chungangensis]|uniref:Homoserine kinase n=1 Tax=Oceanobacillus chungangensis TaxID=1229152 RepID=A0A3D8PYX4_9BACI|nr:homoserine kinase [Oceanobacillus chungangensis]RDW21253.1 homoserine kinase [Oceanobacillus chungangensis]
MKRFTIQVPASSANIGPGFDSLGLAVNLHLNLEVTEADNWEFEHRSSLLGPVTNYEEHFIYQIAKQTAARHNKELRPCKVVETSNIPLARGLGSSSSAVLAGIEIANQLCNLSLTTEEKLQYGTDIEGHPDNIAPALYGGLVIAAITDDQETHWVRLPEIKSDIIVHIPNVELKTEKARGVLPESYSRGQAASASAVSNVLIAALLSSDYSLAGKMMEKDLFHEPYRAELIPNYHLIRNSANEYGAYGTVISGAGPTMISFVPEGAGETIANQMKKILPDYEIKALQIDQTGLKIDCG